MASNPVTETGTFVHGNTTAPEHPGMFSMFSLKGKTAIVSGSGAGIGLAVAHALAEAGANVAMFYNSNEDCKKRASEIAQKYGVQAKAYQCNVTNANVVQICIDTVVKEFNGRLDIFVANAGIPWTKGPMVEGPIDHYTSVTNCNLNGTFYCARAAAAHWRRQKEEGTDLNGKKLVNFTYGSFVATASMSGHIVNFPQMQAAYNAAKAAVIHLCKSLAVEWVKFARANSVSPGYIATEISSFVDEETKKVWKDKTPMGREGEADELKGAYLYLASDASSYTTGADLVVDGGYCCP